MSKIKTFKGQLAIGEEEKIHLSTNDGLTGYRIKKFQTISQNIGVVPAGECRVITKITTTSQTGSITNTIDFSDTDLLATSYFEFNEGSSITTLPLIVIFDNETINQDIFVSCADARGSTVPINYYIELEQFKIDLNTSTYHTLKNLRSKTQI